MHENAYYHKCETYIQSFRLLFFPKKAVVSGLRPSHHGRLTLALLFASHIACPFGFDACLSFRLADDKNILSWSQVITLLDFLS